MSTSNSKDFPIVDDFIAPVCLGSIEILYQDKDILLINKPSGLFSLSGKNPLNWDSVHHRLIYGQGESSCLFPHAKLPHRLDFGTSGIMVVGLNTRSSKSLNMQFQAGTIEKRYIAILDGWLDPIEGRIKAPIAKDKTYFPRVKICYSTGKEAISDYKVLKRLDHPRRSLVEFVPTTGRTHQLRIHSHFVGHPILGCDLYKNTNSEGLASRLLLHASELYFDHPTNGKRFHGKCCSPF